MLSSEYGFTPRMLGSFTRRQISNYLWGLGHLEKNFEYEANFEEINEDARKLGLKVPEKEIK